MNPSSDYWQQWPGSTVVVMASGPSMTQQDADYVEGKAKSIAVNSTFRMAPWADIVYSNDEDWYEAHMVELRRSTSSFFWCGHPHWRHLYVHSIPFERGAPGIVNAPGKIAWGMNSGAAALNLALHFGAARILMLGYDQSWLNGKGHWHPPHPKHLQNRQPGFHRWREWFEQAARDFEALGVEVVNCSRATTLTCFKRADLRDVL